LIRLAYLGFGALVAIGLYLSFDEQAAHAVRSLSPKLIPDTAKLLAPLMVVSMIIINALAVNAITNERDGQALDLLLVSEITPPKFIFGKLLGVLYVAKEMVLLPLAMCIWLWWKGSLSGENLGFLLLGLMVVDIFVAMLGLHCGMIYHRSLTAIATSLGTVFFLFLGILTCMLIMISFQGSFGRQLPPFLMIILGGGIGLYVALGSRNPSPAITLAAFGLPFLTFFAITSFILRGQELTVFSSIAVAYGFATLAMLVPALSEFEFSQGGRQAIESDSP
jgi:ABC-type Na+ efflux pump permease subunit